MNSKRMIKRNGGRRADLYFNSKGLYIFAMLMLMTVALQILNNNVEGKPLHHAKKTTTLKLLQSPSSLIQLRHKRDTFANEQQQEQEGDESTDDANYYDYNYYVLPDVKEGSPSPTLEDQMSERANQIAQSFTNMWQSITDSVKHCVDALRAMFGDDVGEGALTPEQEQQLLQNMQQNYRLKQEHDNEIFANENKL